MLSNHSGCNSTSLDDPLTNRLSLSLIFVAPKAKIAESAICGKREPRIILKNKLLIVQFANNKTFSRETNRKYNPKKNTLL